MAVRPTPDDAAASGPGSGSADPAEPYGIVAIAASAGGITALGRVLGGLPAGFPVPVVVVQHLDPRHKTIIAEVLGRRAKVSVVLAQDGVRVEPGTIYVAPPNHHLLVEAEGVLVLSSSELVHFVRPSADLLFESVAGAYGPRAIACVLTGTGSDGAMGASAIKSRGGTVIAEDPDLAQFKGMPEAVIATGAVDFILPLDEIAAVICGLVEARLS
ncbi:MAG TPA: chemotaxis protein CheB [Streptosporangiaceae bacterium]|nr:chemotaxis protein CheB [Streptosporangiaceae bacterium]